MNMCVYIYISLSIYIYIYIYIHAAPDLRKRPSRPWLTGGGLLCFAFVRCCCFVLFKCLSYAKFIV